MTEDRKTLWWLAPVVAAVLWMTPLPAWLIEAVYSRGLFRVIQTTLTTVSNLTPFAWLDVWLGLAVLLSVRRIVLLVRAGGTTGTRGALADAGRRVLHAVGIVAVVFLFCWGFNYRRVPLEEALSAPAPPSATADDLRDLLIEANALAASLRPDVVQHPVTYAEAAEALQTPFERALGELGQPPLGVFGRPKYTLLTPYFTWAGINGMLDPFALESIVHPDALPFERPFILAHEWGHLAGRADEAEASALGWVACMDGDDRLVYSATVYLVVELADALPPAQWRTLVPTLDPGLRDDLRALSARWARAQPVVQRTSSHVYDQYLRANRVEDGVQSYSRALHLILLPPLRGHISRALRKPAP